MSSSSWCEGGVDETRILIAPDSDSSSSVVVVVNNNLSLLHPKHGKPTCYLFSDDDETLKEVHWFKLRYGSWFLGDYVAQDGSLYIATPVDPVFIFLPIFDQARIKKDFSDAGKFRQLDEIMYVSGHPGYQALLTVAEKAMPVVCEIREIGSSKFFRLDDSKVIAWLNYKVCLHEFISAGNDIVDNVHQLKQTLPTLDKNYAARDERNTLLDAVSIIGDYLKEPLLSLLCNHLELNLQDVIRKAPDIQIPSAIPESKFEPPSQGKNEKDKRITRSSGRQPKKMKMETNSHNIGDMFRRASTRKA